jgi:hypothetical protein
MFKEGGVTKCRWLDSLQKIQEASAPGKSWLVLEIQQVSKKKLG